ncbi:hypothetical protein SAMN05216315_10424 [Nitrosospira sp. Nsp18]|uniref:hypothetical protein n=1 Tax=Nitrosospira sp. Nsp18 TaxID=1855334 RepID=UPI000888966C|nr:hypothetical protein [Nitrosospira sp. Nsp18]SDA13167.1 hypothetical protein SAMN05216315_10424 [Nitrosospira sp. Nsp18]
MATSTTASTYGLLCFARSGGDPIAEATAQPQSQPLLPEIHLNIWEQEADKKSANTDSLLDIGLMIDLNDRTDSIEFIFPAKMPLTSVKDLAPVMSPAQAIPAIFNESWAVISMGSKDAVVYDPSGQSTSFAFVHIEGAIKETQHASHDALSISIPTLITRAKGVAQQTQQTIKRVYIRFRLLKFERLFYCVGAGERSNDWWQPSWQRTEDIDFRLNVRRGAPPGLESTIGRFLEFSKVHLFLMRSRDKDIVFHDKLFKASRSLEDEDFWAQYSILGTQTAHEKSLERVKNSLGYHWKSGSPGPVKEFGTLARFKIVEFGVGKFVAVALIVGAMGGMLWDGVKASYSILISRSPVYAQATGSTGTEPLLPAEEQKLPR